MVITETDRQTDAVRQRKREGRERQREREVLCIFTTPGSISSV